jgi:hypothetical protein
MRPSHQPVAAKTSIFTALGHTLTLRCVMEGRWTVSVDDVVLPRSHGTEVEAWEAGLREVEIQRQQGAALVCQG